MAPFAIEYAPCCEDECKDEQRPAFRRADNLVGSGVNVPKREVLIIGLQHGYDDRIDGPTEQTETGYVKP